MSKPNTKHLMTPTNTRVNTERKLYPTTEEAWYHSRSTQNLKSAHRLQPQLSRQDSVYLLSLGRGGLGKQLCCQGLSGPTDRAKRKAGGRFLPSFSPLPAPTPRQNTEAAPRSQPRSPQPVQTKASVIFQVEVQTACSWLGLLTS